MNSDEIQQWLDNFEDVSVERAADIFRYLKPVPCVEMLDFCKIMSVLLRMMENSANDEKRLTIVSPVIFLRMINTFKEHREMIREILHSPDYKPSESTKPSTQQS